MNAIELHGVVKRFGKFTAVDRLDLAVPKGVTFGLLGPNGAGKTTTLRMIMNITKPDEGTVTVLGQPMSEALQEKIGYLPEERGLYRKMKVVDQLLFFAAIKGVDRDDRDEAALALDRLDGPPPVAPEEDRGAVEGDAAEGPVPRDDRPRPGDPDPGRAVLRPRPDQRHPREGLLPGVQAAGKDGRLLDARPRAGRAALRADLPPLPVEEAPRRDDPRDQERLSATGSRSRPRSSRSRSWRRSSSRRSRNRASPAPTAEELR